MAPLIVAAAEIAERHAAELRARLIPLAAAAPSARRPRLVAILAHDEADGVDASDAGAQRAAAAAAASSSYAAWTQRACESLGADFTLERVPRTGVEAAIMRLNDDAATHGVLVYYPVFGAPHDGYLQSCVSPRKDVEGLCHLYKRNLYQNVRVVDGKFKSVLPCTPLAVVKIIEHLGLYAPQLDGRVVTIFNRSEVVGRPLAALLANDGALVYSVDINDVLEYRPGVERHHVASETHVTRDDALAAADIVVTAVPNAAWRLPTHVVLKPNVVVINVASCENVDVASLPDGARFVPAVGKVTVTMLLRNLWRLYEDYSAKT